MNNGDSSPPEDSSERRSCNHDSFEVEVTLWSASHFFAGLSGDIAQGGVFVSTYRCLPIGTEVIVAFSLPGGEPLTVRGNVRWVISPADETHPGLGVAFAALPAASEKRIRDFCRARPPLYYDDEDLARGDAAAE